MYVEPTIGPPEKVTVPPLDVIDPAIVFAAESKVDARVPEIGGEKPKSFTEEEVKDLPEVTPLPCRKPRT